MRSDVALQPFQRIRQDWFQAFFSEGLGSWEVYKGTLHPGIQKLSLRGLGFRGYGVRDLGFRGLGFRGLGFRV